MKNLLLSLLLIPFLSFSQEDNSKFSLGFLISPELNGLITKNPVGKETVKEKMGFSLGLNLEFRFTKTIALRSGLGYGLARYSHFHEGLIFGTDINPQSGFISESKLESKISYSEVQLPVLLQVKFNPHFFTAVGFELNGAFADNSKRIIHLGNGTNTTLANKDGVMMNYALMISFGFIVPNTQLSIEPMLKYYFKEHIIPEAKHYTLGLKMTYNIVN